ncbi:MAG: type secretion system protein ImpH [Gammaproteobacteria bacterium]|jgi:type VI secretion system protein ImpH|nr:type secretion system protein ImpH [Gammaproteobacteria bacterium]
MSLLDDLHDQPERYTLFAALRKIEQAHRDRPRLGESRKAADDPVRISQRPHLYFAASDIAAFASADTPVPRVEQHGFGIFGPNGALPLHLTEMAYSREHQADDPALSDFVNAFQHRFTSLFYRAWADSDPCASFDRPGEDDFRLYVGALMGLGPAAAQNRDSVLDYAKLARVGLFAPQNRSAEALQQILSEYFELPVEIIPFVGAWLDISVDARCRIGVEPQHATLGLGATLGNMTWQCQSRFEIALGPLGVADFVNFLPGARGLTQLKSLVRLYTNEEWSWQTRLLLEPDQIPPMRLGEGGWLGWTSWLGARAQVARDAVIEGSEPAAPR